MKDAIIVVLFAAVIGVAIWKWKEIKTWFAPKNSADTEGGVKRLIAQLPRHFDMFLTLKRFKNSENKESLNALYLLPLIQSKTYSTIRLRKKTPLMANGKA